MFYLSTARVGKGRPVYSLEAEARVDRGISVHEESTENAENISEKEGGDFEIDDNQNVGNREQIWMHKQS